MQACFCFGNCARYQSYQCTFFLPVSRNRMYISLGASFHHFAYNCKSVARSSVPQAREIETLVKDRLLVPQAHEMETLAKDR